MVSDATRLKRTILAVCLILAAALLLRVINLDADPSALISRDVITDEGWWAHNARNAVLYGQWRIDDYNQGLYSGYLYNALLYFVFVKFGISFTIVRMLSALTGWLTVVLVFLLVRREISTRAALFSSVFLGFSNLHIIYSRTGFVESMMVFFLCLALWLWSLRRKHGFFALLSGVAFALSLLTKITAIYCVPGLALFIVVASIRHSMSRRETLSFLAGAGAVVAVYTIWFIVPNFGDWLRFNLALGSGTEWTTGLSARIHSIIKLLGSPFYAEAPFVTALTLLALGLFVVGSSRNGLMKTIRAAGELEITSATLLLGYLCSLSFTVYQPERRFLPALCLMVILSAAVLDKGWTSLETLKDADCRMNAVGWFTVLFLLPLIGILELRVGPALSAGSVVLKLIAFAGLSGIAVALSRGLWPYRLKKPLMLASRMIFVLLFFCLSLGLVYKALLLWGLNAFAGRSTDHQILLAVGALVLAFGVVISRLLRDARRAAPLLLGVFLLIEGIQISTWLFQPAYTLKEASASLAGTLTREDTVVTYYETVLLSTAAKVVCRSERRGFNVDVFETSSPQYILVLRRDNWKDYGLEEMPPEEWPPPAWFVPTKVAGFDLCPTRSRGPRFIMELYRLNIRTKRHKRSPAPDTDL